MQGAVAVSLDDTWGEADFAHWEILVADRLRYERGLIDRDPCATWTAADTAAFLAWSRSQTGTPRNGTDRLRYLEFCCQSQGKPLGPDELATEIARLTTVAVSNPLQDHVAAFLDWVVPKQYSADELSMAYRAFCTQTNAAPVADRLWKDCLKRFPSVRKSLDDRRISGRRQRPVVWTIEAHRGTRTGLHGRNHQFGIESDG